MALQGNGKLLVKVKATPFAKLFAAASPLNIPGYTLEPLSAAVQARPQFSAALPADHWLLAKPIARAAAAPTANPWDAAHAAAGASDYAHYIEPDILHVRPEATGKLDHGLNKYWEPKVDPNIGVSPGWHLLSDHADFVTAWTQATGTGVRIAHLDTGYTKDHASKPRNLLEDLGKDFWDETRTDATDPGTPFFGVLQPGHGTATLALLAGNRMKLTFGTKTYDGDFGGAPDASVVPVRISPTVIHLYTSSMAKGLLYALAPGSNPANRCDVVTISHGGLPTQLWADAVNTLYEDGIVVVAASGDSIYLVLVDLATRYTVYPSAFNRVITAVGVTYDKKPYITSDFDVMQGCWGPDSVMEKAIAAFTPNVAWMNYKDTPDGFDMNGGGTSASTPQIAAACALWLQLYREKLPADWRRVEACRLALFDRADDSSPNKSELGWGLLDASAMLDAGNAAAIIAKANADQLTQSPADSVSVPILRLLFGEGPPQSEEERMYETEVAQTIANSSNAALLQAARAAAAPGAALAPAERSTIANLIQAEGVSAPLQQRLAKL